MTTNSFAEKWGQTAFFAHSSREESTRWDGEKEVSPHFSANYACYPEGVLVEERGPSVA
jgi:hypothetical protein